MTRKQYKQWQALKREVEQRVSTGIYTTADAVRVKTAWLETQGITKH